LSQISLMILQNMGWILLIMMAVVIPGSAKTRIRAKFFGSGVLVTLCTPDGFEQDMYMKVDMKYGVFTHKEETYIFTPQPKFVSAKIKDETTGKTNPVTQMDVPENVQQNVDEAINHRMLTDTGKTHYIGLVHKGIAVTPALLGLIKEVNKDAAEENVKQLKLINPQALSKCISQSFSQAAIENMRFSAEERGFLRRPALDALQKNKVAIAFILMAGIGVFLILSGKVDLGRIFGKYLEDGTTAVGMISWLAGMRGR